MPVPFSQLTRDHNQNLTVAHVDHLPIIAHYLRKLGLVKIINDLVPVEMAVEPGLIVLGF